MPPPFKVVPLTMSAGASDPWLARTYLSPVDVVKGLGFNHTQTESINAALYAMLEELIQSASALRKAAELEQKGPVVPLFDLQREYDTTYDHLWRAYKDRMQAVVRTLGYDIGFLFKNDADFEKGASAFPTANPDVHSGFIEMLRGDRRTWQTALAQYRNGEQHTGDNQKKREAFFHSNAAQSYFTNCWQAIEEILIILMRARVIPPYAIVEIPEAERNPAMPQRFRLTLNLSMPPSPT